MLKYIYSILTVLMGERMAGEKQVGTGSLRRRIILLISFLFAIGVALSFWLAAEQSEDILIQDAIEDANLLAKSLEAFRTYYSDVVASRAVVAGVDVRHDFRDATGALPLPFTMHSELSRKIGEAHFGTETRIYSDHPYPWNKTGGVRDRFERDALTALTRSPNKPFYRVEGEGDQRVLRFAKADLMRESCIGCHNNTPESLKRDWRVGDVAGVMSISVPLNPEHRLLHGKLGAGYVLVAVLLVFLIIALYAMKTISNSSIQDLEAEVRRKIFELEEAEESLDAAQKVGGLGNWSLNLATGHLWVSHGLLNLLGISGDLFDGSAESLFKHIHEDERDAFRGLLEQRGDDGSHAEIDCRVVLAGGEMRYLHAEIDVVTDPSGSRRRQIGVVRDITEKRAREVKLRMLSNALEQAGEAVLITDSSNNIHYVNKTFVDVTGYTTEEVVGKNPNILSSGRHGKEFYHRMWDELQSKGFWKGRIWNRRKNGDVYPEQIHIRAIVDSQGKVINYAAVFSDITEQLKMEQAIRQSQKMEAVGTLVGGIAHDFNNILTAITGTLYLIKRDVESLPKVKSKIESIEEESFRAAEMIGQLLTFARKDMVSRDEIDFASVYQAAKGLARVALSEEIDFQWEDCEVNARVSGDENQLKQIILNLVNNARDALEGVEKPEIRVSLTRYKPDGEFASKHPEADFDHYACLEVSDNGCGIAKSTLEHIFEPFYTTKDTGKGTGLGLAMVYGSVTGHHGVIDVESDVGVGTTFRIYLPVLERSPEHLMEESTWSGVVRGDGQTILVVDDEDIVLNIARDLLTSIGYKVIEASDGASAVDVFKANRVDIGLVMLDVVMPRMGGVQAATLIREVSPDIPIIFATGYDQDSVLTGVEEWKNITILGKPYRAKQISLEIQKLLS